MAYAQRNYPQPLGDGSCGLSIAQAGCYVTTDADILTWAGFPIDPPTLNAEYLRKGLFAEGCLIAADTLARARPVEIALAARDDFPGAADLRRCDNTADGDYIALKILYPHGLQNDNPHFLPVYRYRAGQPAAELLVCDSWDAQIKPLNRYGDPATIIASVMRYRVVAANPPPPSPPPPPEAPPAPPPAPPQLEGGGIGGGVKNQ
jgi:hypothetical protein